METITAPSPEAAEILESLTFIEKECLAAWQHSAKTVKELSLLREARACIQMKMKILNIGTRQSPPALPEPEPAAQPAEAEPAVAQVPQAPAEPAETPINAFRRQYTPEQFNILDVYTRMGILKRFGISEAEAKANGYRH